MHGIGRERAGPTMRGRLSAVGLSAALVLGALVGLAPGTAVAAGTTSGQVITVFAANSTTTWATPARGAAWPLCSKRDPWST